VSTNLLLFLDLALGGLTAAGWAGACVVGERSPSRRSSLLGSALILGALLGVVGQAATAFALTARADGLAQEKLLFAVPVQLVFGVLAAVVVLPALLRRARVSPQPRPRWAAAALVAAAASSVVGLVARGVVGYPVTLPAAAVLLTLVLLAGWLGHALLTSRVRRQMVGAATLIGLLVVASVGFSWVSDVAVAVALADHAGPFGHRGPPRGPDAHRAAPTPASGVSVADLRTPADAPGTLRHFDLTAGHQTVTAASGKKVEAESFGSLPGPELRVQVGDLVEVVLNNRDIEEGVTLHWHGYDVPNGEDGVAGATQDAVLPGETFTYRFRAEEPGTYWYHTHQASADGIRHGLYGTLVVLPPGGIAEDTDVAIALHTFGSAVWLGESDEARTETVPEGAQVRARLINTDQVPRHFRVTGAPYRVVAVDGRDLTGPTEVTDRGLRVPAGGRLDVVFTVPAGGVRVGSDASSRVAVGFGPKGSDPLALDVDVSAPELDLLSYGTPGTADVPSPTREASLVLDRLPRFLRGLPSNAYTVNGAVFPHIENIEVQEGDVLRLTVVNRGWDTHPMHLHGHHALVLSRNGVAATGAQLWVDTFDVQPGEVWQVLVEADNPGIWMDHCHNLDHAEQGMMMALTYRGVITPFDHQHISG
jgi:FtsP/CotA-like multicopper oxidase with cupredoxin domain